MALIKCPECGKDVSDQAPACPNCGYILKPDSQVTKEDSFFQKNRITIIIAGAIIISVILILVYINSIPEKSPFEKLTPRMTQEEGIELLGNADDSDSPDADTDYYVDRYNNIGFMGLNGRLKLWYNNNEEKSLNFGIWEYELGADQSFNDYEKKLTKIVNFFTEAYGTPNLSGYYDYEWEDYNGAEIGLELNKDDSGYLPDEIQLWFQ